MKRIAGSTLVALLLAAGPLRAQPVDTLHATPIPGMAFRDARSIAIDPMGALYVADAGRDVVVKFDVLGRLIATVGGPGSREGEFDDPSAVDPTNSLALYVADAGNHRIQIFSKAFAYLGSIPLVRTGEAGSARVTYRRQDDETAGFPSGRPIAVATTSSNEVFAVDSDARVVLKWTENRRLARVIGGVDAGSGALGEPVDLWVGPESLLYVADRGARAVVVFDQYGTFVRSLGGGRLDGLRSVIATGDHVVAVLDRALMFYEVSGRFARRVEIDIRDPIVDAAVAPDGSLYLLDAARAYHVGLMP